MLVDPRAFELASNLLDHALALERFHPGTHADPESEKPLAGDSHWLELVHGPCPKGETLGFYEQSHVQLPRTHGALCPDRLLGGIYHRPTYPAHAAVASLICAAHCSYVGILPIRPTIITLTDVELIHKQWCSESPECWSYSVHSLSNSACTNASRQEAFSSTALGNHVLVPRPLPAAPT